MILQQTNIKLKWITLNNSKLRILINCLKTKKLVLRELILLLKIQMIKFKETLMFKLKNNSLVFIKNKVH